MTSKRYNLRPRKTSLNKNQVPNNNNDNRKRKREIEQDNFINKPKKAKPTQEIINLKKWEMLNNCGDLQIGDDYDENDLWVSATSISNYLMNDPIIDWLEYYYNTYGYNENPEESVKLTKSRGNNKNNSNILFEMGHKFENEVVNELRDKHKNLVKRVCNNVAEMSNKRKVEDTLKYMLEGVPIIEQAMLVNEKNKTYGVADLVIRSDYINKIFNEEIIEEKTVNIKAPKLNGNYHYVVVDIKWSQIPLAANGRTILNKDRYTAYKGQLAIYSLALGILQHYIPNNAYILGKGCSTSKKTNNNTEFYNCFERAGVVDYNDYDEHYIELTQSAVQWIREVRLKGYKWSCTNPLREEMYPNMCISNSKWDIVKKDIAMKIKELTQFWMVGYKNRKYGHDNGIETWDHPDCTSEALNIHGKKISPILNKLLEVNKSTDTLIYPKIIKNNTENWQTEYELDFIIDFETLNECLVDTSINLYNSKKNTNVIYLIGVGYKENNKFSYKYFIMNDFNLNEEKRILIEFKEFIEERIKAYMQDKKIKNRNLVKPKMFHWAFAENNFLRLANNRHNNFLNKWLNSITLVDLCKIFTEEPIVVKNMYKFKLKDVARAMLENNFIETKWKELCDGELAMRESSKYYRDKWNGKGDNKELIKEIIDYNEIDCKVLWEIIEYLRKNHCSKN